MSYGNPGRRVNKTAYSVLETLVDAGFPNLEAIYDPQKVPPYYPF